MWKTIVDDNENVTDYCHVTNKSRSATHWNCNINL